ncbi:MAG TPA: CHASE3 domain-containing protein [Polyangiaceae bacterium]|nr:CHASE3 domain-containing protein [Polyangiaceae bacterium]
MADILKFKRFGWSVTFALVTLVALLSYVSGRRYLAAVRAVEHTLAVQSAIDATLSLLKDAETGQRGYTLTGDPQFLEPYQTARTEIPRRIAQLSEVMQGDSAQLGRLTSLRQLIDDKLAHIDAVLQLRRTDEPRALALVRAGRGKLIMDRIRAVCRAMSEHEAALLQVRKREAHASEVTAIWGIGIGSVAMVLVALFSLITVQRDVEQLKHTAEELAASEEHYRMLTEQSSDLVRLLDLNGAIVYVNSSVERLLGYSVEEYLAQPPRSLMHPDELGIAAEIMAEIRQRTRREGVSTYRLRHKSGEFLWFEVHWAVRRDAQGAPRDVHTVGRDVTARLASERRLNAYANELKTMSLRDELTGLYNRRGFMEAAELAHSRALNEARFAALIFIDLNGMKRINDELGHDVGDQALCDAAEVLRSALRSSDVVARLGGDEFVAFASDFRDTELEPLRNRLRKLGEQRTIEQARSFRLSMSVGAAWLLPGSVLSLSELLEQADAAMYEQKNARRAAGGISVAPPPPNGRA